MKKSDLAQGRLPGFCQRFEEPTPTHAPSLPANSPVGNLYPTPSRPTGGPSKDTRPPRERTRAFSPEVYAIIQRTIRLSPTFNVPNMIAMHLSRGEWVERVAHELSSTIHEVTVVEYNWGHRPVGPAVKGLCASCNWQGLCGLHSGHPSCDYNDSNERDSR